LLTTCSPLTSPKTRRSFLAGLLVAVAACAHAQHAGPFTFASQEQARAVLGARDDYVRATAALERSAVLRTPGTLDIERFAATMQETALAWTQEEQRAFDAVLPPLQQFISAMRWKAPSPILIVKAEDRLMDGFPHTRGNAIVLQVTMLRDAMADAALMTYLMAHEAFHVLSRANPELREELYGAIGFRPCASVDMPAPLTRLRLTNPDAPESRYTIAARRNGRPVEVLPFVHFPSEAIDPRGGFGGRMRTSWLLVERRGTRCTARESAQPVDLSELEGFYEQTGRNTGYVIHPEEILADNFALLFHGKGNPPPKVASPEILERIRRLLERR
jgi:hypothetical protein